MWLILCLCGSMTRWLLEACGLQAWHNKRPHVLIVIDFAALVRLLLPLLFCLQYLSLWAQHERLIHPFLMPMLPLVRITLHCSFDIDRNFFALFFADRGHFDAYVEFFWQRRSVYSLIHAVFLAKHLWFFHAVIVHGVRRIINVIIRSTRRHYDLDRNNRVSALPSAGFGCGDLNFATTVFHHRLLKMVADVVCLLSHIRSHST